MTASTTILEKFPLILHLDISGMPLRWITYEDACYYEAKNLIAWKAGEVSFNLRGGTNAITGKQSILTLNTIIAIRSHRSSAHLPATNRVPLTNKTLFRRDWNICAYCGDKFSQDHLTRDHIKPVSKGGLNKWENVVSACSDCNKKKDARTPEEAGMKLLYLPYRPNKNEHLILSNRKILADQMAFLIKNLPKESRIHGKEKQFICQ